MPRRSGAARPREVLARFRREYEPRYSFLNHETPYQLLVAVVLSAQTMDKVVNKVTPRLFAAHPDPASMMRASPDEVEALIDGVGFARSKARYLVEGARMLVEEFGGQLPRAMDDLVRLPGVGKKTASVVQGYVWGEADAVAVDTHVRRVAQRLDLTRQKDPDKISADLGKTYSSKDWPDLNYYFIQHGRTVCVARHPRCGDCVVQDLCPKRGVLKPATDPEAPKHPAAKRGRAGA